MEIKEFIERKTLKMENLKKNREIKNYRTKDNGKIFMENEIKIGELKSEIVELYRVYYVNIFGVFIREKMIK